MGHGWRLPNGTTDRKRSEVHSKADFERVNVCFPIRDAAVLVHLHRFIAAFASWDCEHGTRRATGCHDGCRRLESKGRQRGLPIPLGNPPFQYLLRPRPLHNLCRMGGTTFHCGFHNRPCLQADLLEGVGKAEAENEQKNLLPLSWKENMARNTIPIDRYVEAAQVFHWATKEHFILWFTGDALRHRRTESVLHKLVQKGKLRSVRFGKRLVYTVPRRTKGKIPTLVKDKTAYEAGVSEKAVLGANKIIHGLACTESLVRLWRARTDGEIIAERHFYGLGAVPEWGIRYPNGKMLLFEFCTKSNFLFSNNMNGKLSAYQAHLQDIESKFNAEAVVLFVLDISRDNVERYVGSLDGRSAPSPTANASALHVGDTFPFNPLFFTDYETFLKVPIGKQLTEPIYFWCHDGRLYPLSKNA